VYHLETIVQMVLTKDEDGNDARNRIVVALEPIIRSEGDEQASRTSRAKVQRRSILKHIVDAKIWTLMEFE